MKASSSTLHNVYIHVPFCTGKCSYCAFYSEVFETHRADLYLEALEAEIKTAATQFEIAPVTIYIGGGTPSLLAPPQWRRLCRMLQRHLNLGKLSEWTVEATPGTLTDELLVIWQENSIHRISLGAQSMCDQTLARLNRRHQVSQTIDTVQRLQKSGFSQIGLDLIACLPGVTSTAWFDTLHATLALAPTHISVYAFSIEPGSLFFDLHRTGQLAAPEESAEIDALAEAASLLTGSGYEHYEISNFALPDHRCLYNQQVWEGEDYIGFGPAAASRAGRQRWINNADVTAYCRHRPAQPVPRETEVLSPETDAAERLIFRLRLSDPLSLEHFASQHGPAARRLVPYWQAQLEEMARYGLVIRQGGHWQHTHAGWRMVDTIGSALLPPES